MHAFLEEVAQHSYKQYLNKQVRFLFPTKRAKFYFRKYLGQKTQKASLYNRNLMTIEEFLIKEGMRGWNIADELTLLLELYEVIQNLPEDNTIRWTSGFDKFYNLGKIILSDFNDVDNYLVRAGDIFQNLSELKTIETRFNDILTQEQIQYIRQFWSTFKEENSQEQEYFLKLWEQLPEIYEHFTQRLIKKRMGYQGLLYRLFVQKLENGSYRFPPNRLFVAVGFNALNKAQEKFFEKANKEGKIKFFWDWDKHYTEDEQQEAGTFLRSNTQKFNSDIKYAPANLNVPEKSVSLHAVQGNAAQAKLVHDLLNALPGEAYKHTAVVLGDEQLLFPVLSAIPAHIEQINVTMGYPLKHTALYAFIKRYIALQTGIRPETKAKQGYYFQEVVSLLRHTYVKNFNPAQVQALIDDIYHRQLIYIKQEELAEAHDDFLFYIFERADNADQLFTNLLNILFHLFTTLDAKEGTGQLINKEFIYQAYKAVQRLKDTLTHNLKHLHLNTAVKLLNDHLNGLTIPFEAESQEGLQIMGLMETRNIDFRHVILVGANEGVIPKITTAPTFISESLRFGFGLPVTAQQDAIFAYVFYRLMQRAQSADLLYNSLTNEDQVGEMSRFVRQLLHEARFNITQKLIKPEPVPVSTQPIQVEKTPEVMNRLRQYLWNEGKNSKSFSASSLINYIACPLRFYYDKIAGLQETPEVEEEISYAAFGEILHQAMEKLYGDFINTKASPQIEPGDFDAIGKNLDNAIIAAFKTYYEIPEKEPMAFEGNQRVMKEVLNRYGSFILKADKRYAPFTIKSLEKSKNYKAYLPVTTEDGPNYAALYGIIDRVDEKDGITRIVDYKTGEVFKKLNNGLQPLFESNTIDKYKAVFQMLHYTWLYQQKNPQDTGKLKPVIYAVRIMTDPTFNGELQHQKGPYGQEEIASLIDNFAESLQNTLNEIFDPSQPFEQTTHPKNCEYCPFNTICAIHET